MNTIRNIYSPSQINESIKNIVGQKTIDLVNLSEVGINVASYFVISDYYIKQWLKQNKILEYFDTKNNSKKDLDNLSSEIRKVILGSEFSKEFIKELTHYYQDINKISDSYVLMRLCGEYFLEGGIIVKTSFLSNIAGVDEILTSIKLLLISIFDKDNLDLFLNKGLNIENLVFPILVQKMIQPEVSGNCYTINPLNNNENELLIESILGMYDPLIDMSLVPDSYVVDKSKIFIKEKKISKQEWMLVRNTNIKDRSKDNIRIDISSLWQNKQKLDDKYINSLSKLVMKITKEIDKSNEMIIWFYEGGKFWIYDLIDLNKLVITIPEKTDKIDLTKESDIEYKTVIPKDKLGKNKELIDNNNKEIIEDNIEVEETSEMIDISEDEIENSEKLEKSLLIGQKDETTLKSKNNSIPVLLNGTSVVDGFLIGRVKLIFRKDDIKDINKGTILVIENSNKDLMDGVKESGGVIIDQSGQVNDIALLAKDYFIPCISGTVIASKMLRNGEIIALDSSRGIIYESNEEAFRNYYKVDETDIKTEEKIEISNNENSNKEKNQEKVTKRAVFDNKNTTDVSYNDLDTEKISATKVMLNITDPFSISTNETMIADGIGLLRSEYILSNISFSNIESKENNPAYESMIMKVAQSVTEATAKMLPKPVIYRLSDFKSNDIILKPNEKNPSLGIRGSNRLLRNQKIMDFELDVIRRVRNIANYKNLWLSIPYARSVKELQEMKQLIQASGLKRSSTFKLFASIETPANYFNLSSILDIGFDGIIVDTNDLIQLLLGVEYSSMAFTDYNIEESGIIHIIEEITEKSSDAKIPVIFTGDYISERLTKELIEHLVESGVYAISINKDSLMLVKDLVSKAEVDLLLSKRKKGKKTRKLAKFKRKVK